MTLPIEEDASTASPEPQNDAIRVLKAPAAVSWTDSSRPCFLSHDPLAHNHVTFDIHFDNESHTAFFKITANIAFKGKRNKSNIFLFVDPELIQTLALVDNDDSAAPRLGTSAHSLHFSLSVPASLVVPKGDWVPKNEEARSILASLQALARQTSFHIAFPLRSLALDRLAMLCQKASSSGCLKTMTDVANVAKLYGGEGGRIIEHGVNQGLSEVGMSMSAQEAELDQRQPLGSPPSYDELDSPPPHPPVKKRRRIESDAVGDASQEKISLEDICRHGFAEMARRFDRIEKSLSDLNSRLDRVEQLAGASHKGKAQSSEQPDHQPDDLDERVEAIEERVAGVEKKLDAGLNELAQDVENQLYDVRHEFNDTISVRVEDEMGVAQSQLEDFIKDELRNAALDVEENVRETLRDALA